MSLGFWAASAAAVAVALPGVALAGHQPHQPRPPVAGLPDFPPDAEPGACYARRSIDGPGAAVPRGPDGQPVWTLKRGHGPEAVWRFDVKPGGHPGSGVSVDGYAWVRVPCPGEPMPPAFAPPPPPPPAYEGDAPPAHGPSMAPHHSPMAPHAPPPPPPPPPPELEIYERDAPPPMRMHPPMRRELHVPAPHGPLSPAEPWLAPPRHGPHMGPPMPPPAGFHGEFQGGHHGGFHAGPPPHVFVAPAPPPGPGPRWFGSGWLTWPGKTPRW